MLRGQWRSVIVKSGAPSVMMAGMKIMQQSSANSWDLREQVGCDAGEGLVTYQLITYYHWTRSLYVV